MKTLLNQAFPGFDSVLPWHTNNIFVIPSYPFKHLEAAILL